MAEHDEQAALVACCRLHAGRYPALANLFAVPNAARRGFAVARAMLAEGLAAGVPDLFLAWPSGGYHGLFLELKVGRNRPSAAQQDWLGRLQAAGYRAVVCYGWQAGWAEITAYLGITGEMG